MGLEEKLAALECEIDNLRRRVAELEFEKAQRDGPFMPHPSQPYQPLRVPSGCSVCGLKFDGPMGYVCNHPYCPTRVTC